MIANSTTGTKKSRGRPKTAFISKKPKIKQSGPGRPKKVQETIVLPNLSDIKDISKRTIPQESKKKDTFILGMFLFSLCIFGTSLYFSQKKQEITNTPPSTIETSIEDQDTGISETNDIATGNENTGNINTEEPKAISTEMILLSSFYEAFNKGTIDQIYPNINTSLRGSKLFKAYFSKTRTQRFLRNLTANGVVVSDIQNDEKQNPTISYKLSYTLLDGKSFEETRSMQILNKETPQIAKMMCINTGCSTFPFFNPGKYAIH
ncbi:MAG: hypothetical protein WCO66_04655 [Candidatus Absconditabacteria bacterium]